MRNANSHSCLAAALVTLVATSVSAQQSSAATPADTITIAAVGDVMLGSTYRAHGGRIELPPDDGANLLAAVTPLLSRADVAFGNLEGPLADGGVTHKCGAGKSCFAFRSPTHFGRLLKSAGFSVVSLANNHALDFGSEGRTSTVRTLDELGIAHSGGVGDIAHLVVKGRRIALIAFSTGGPSYNLNDLSASENAVRQLVAGGELVVVSFHGGAEGASRQHVPPGVETFHHENRGDLRRFAHAMIDAGASLVLGHGPHVVRGLELYRDHPIAYSLGNFATYGAMHLAGPTRLSLVLEVSLGADGRFVGGRVHPLVQPGLGGPVQDPDGKVIAVVQRLSRQDFAGSALALSDEGVLSASRAGFAAGSRSRGSTPGVGAPQPTAAVGRSLRSRASAEMPPNS